MAHGTLDRQCRPEWRTPTRFRSGRKANHDLHVSRLPCVPLAGLRRDCRKRAVTAPNVVKITRIHLRTSSYGRTSRMDDSVTFPASGSRLPSVHFPQCLIIWYLLLSQAFDISTSEAPADCHFDRRACIFSYSCVSRT